jgi:hypothetical protein
VQGQAILIARYDLIVDVQPPKVFLIWLEVQLALLSLDRLILAKMDRPEIALSPY